ncbi:hypothetical protein E3A20_20660, partial [Planctomyces bekefii]
RGVAGISETAVVDCLLNFH